MLNKNSYTKTYKIELQIDPSSIDKFKKDIGDALKSIRNADNDIKDGFLENIEKEFVEYQSNLKKIEMLKSDISKISLLGDTKENRALYNSMNKALKELKQSAGISEKGSIAHHEELRKKAIDEVKDFAKTKLKNLVSSIVDFAKDAWNELSSMASYNLADSLIINPEARQQAMTYGLSPEQNYAFSKVKSEMGIQTDEDLFYMNEAQRERFAERIGYFTNKYTEAQESGIFKTIQEFQIEFTEFKEEVMMDIAQFFIENKDEIKLVLKGAIEFFKIITQSLLWLVSFFSGGKERTSSEKAAIANDILKNVSTVNTKTNNTNMNMSPQYNFYGNENSAKIEEIQRQQFEQLYKAYSQ